MAANSSALDAARRGPRREPGARPAGDQQPDPRDDPVHRLRGDVLRGPLRRVLQRPPQRHPVAAVRERASRSMPFSLTPRASSLAGYPDGDPRAPLGDDAAGASGRSAGATGRVFLRNTAVTLVLGARLPGRPALRLHRAGLRDHRHRVRQHVLHADGLPRRARAGWCDHARASCSIAGWPDSSRRSTTTRWRRPRSTGTSWTSSGSRSSRRSTCSDGRRIALMIMRPRRAMLDRARLRRARHRLRAAQP